MKCPHCKREIENNSVFCEFCGQKVKRAIWPVFLVLGIVLVGVVIVISVNNAREKREREITQLEQYEVLLRDSIQYANQRQQEAELAAFNRCSSANACRQYLRNFPGGSHASTVVAMLEQFVKDSLVAAQREAEALARQRAEAQAQSLGSSYSSTRSGTKYVVINGTELRLRLGPSTSADTFKWGDGSNRHPNKGEKYRYLGEEGDFYKIDYKGHKLWVSKFYTYIEYY